jgi:hypothetical protein
MAYRIVDEEGAGLGHSAVEKGATLAGVLSAIFIVLNQYHLILCSPLATSRAVTSEDS